MRALLALCDDAEALGMLLEEGELGDVERYVEERGEALQVSLGTLERLAAAFTAPGSWHLPPLGEAFRRCPRRSAAPARPQSPMERLGPAGPPRPAEAAELEGWTKRALEVFGCSQGQGLFGVTAARSEAPAV